MNAKSILVAAAILAIVLPLRSDPPKPPAAAAPIDAMIVELKQIGELVKQLDDNSFARRQEASERLIRIGAPVIEPLKRQLAAKPSLEMANRIAAVLRAVRNQEREKNKNGEKLTQFVTLEQGIPPNTAFKEALDFLADRYDLTIVVDSNAFTAIGVEKVDEQPVQLPKMAGVRLRDVFRFLLAQVRGENHDATYLIRPDYIEITTTLRADPQRWVGADRRHAPKVDAEFNGEELEDALRALAYSSGINVVLDGRTVEKSSVTATLREMPLDAAVRVLADMAGLKMVVMPHALYVTSAENAKLLEVEKQRQREQEQPKAAGKKPETKP